MESSDLGQPSFKVLVVYENVSQKVMKTLGGFLLNQIRTFTHENPQNTVRGACAGTFGFDGYHLAMDGFTFQDIPRSMECLMPAEDFKSSDFNIAYEQECTVPKYDLLVTKELEGKRHHNKKSKKLQRRNGRRCFNCRSYNHTVDRCFQAVNKEEVKQNIRAFNEAKQGGGNVNSPQVPPPPLPPPNNVPQRNPPSRQSTVEFKEQKPGEITEQLRDGLGIGESDPPPWLFRMRELGPPPAYSDSLGPVHAETKRSRCRPSSASTSGAEEGEIQSEEEDEEKEEEPNSKRLKLHQDIDELELDDQSNKVYYPGINGPVPDGGDFHRWQDGGRTEYYKRISQHSNGKSKNFKNSKSSDLSNCSTTIVVASPMLPSGPIIQNGGFRCMSGLQPFASFGEISNGWCLGNRGFVTTRSEQLPQFSAQPAFFAPFQG
eukprot:TRINITY_DN10130_c0_g1_i1.p1 TRINITY_DN10130_c0_g1~~TRINITY_DN10130_c0_g1_i1.p1  ORF type:complete len:432 (-),score=64.52 TRINITY_DN10130_c0_g1_i1:223-1518(-)